MAGLLKWLFGFIHRRPIGNMKFRSVELRVKIKSLIAEAGIIRLEERRQLLSVRRHNEAIAGKEAGAPIVATVEELRSKIAECHRNYVSLHTVDQYAESVRTWMLTKEVKSEVS